MRVPDDIGPLCLVTGGSGFVGRVLVRRLIDAGYRVRVFDRVTHRELDSRCELVLGDLRARAEVRRALRGVNTVFHAASLIHLAGVASAATRRHVREVNVGGTANVIDACIAENVRQLVYTSTNNVVLDAEIVNGDERAAYTRRPVDLYSETKIASERLVLEAGMPGPLHTCALRPGGIWGPYEGGVMLERVLDQIAQGIFAARIGHGSLADNTHVDNLCDAQLAAARALVQTPERVSGQAYFITDGEPMDPLDWFAPLLEGLGARVPTLTLPAGVMYGLGYVSEWVHRLGGPRPLLTRIEVLKVTRRHSFRIDKARADLGYTPRIRSAEGLKECLPYARNYLERRRAELRARPFGGRRAG